MSEGNIVNDLVGNPSESLEIFESNKVKRQGNTRYYLMPIRPSNHQLILISMNERTTSNLIVY